MPSLIEKWETKEAWQRSLFSRAGVIWLFRDELMDLKLRRSRWLGNILQNAYLTIDVHAVRATTNEEAFNYSLELIRNGIDQRIAQVGDDDELRRLLKLTEDAQPFDSIREIFHQLTTRTHSVYRMTPTRKVQLKLEWLNDHPLRSKRPGEFNDQYHLDACTKIQQDLSVVELRIYLDEFDVPSLLAIPALLTHELICHAYANEDSSDQHSIWAEGVMDWAAAFFFERWSPRLDLPYALVKEHGEDLWSRRTRTARYSGRFIADSLVQWLVNDPSIRGLDMARQVAARFALEVNVADAPLLAKDELASRIANIRTDPALQEAFQSWRARSIQAVEMMR
jgi:hypothetical protein